MTPQSTAMTESPHSTASMLEPNSPNPPRGTILKVPI